MSKAGEEDVIKVIAEAQFRFSPNTDWFTLGSYAATMLVNFLHRHGYKIVKAEPKLRTELPDYRYPEDYGC